MLNIKPMQLADLKMVLDWAIDEGWNPGLDDAAAFLAADPGGFLLGEIDGNPVAAISVVRHSDRFGFLGLYLCRPDFRGQGHGWALWQAGMAYLGQRSVGLDGVAAQQENYQKSGFIPHHRTIRHSGAFSTGVSNDNRITSPTDLSDLLNSDAKIMGFTRRAYMSGWYRDTATRKSLVFIQDGTVAGIGSIRNCRHGHKIGPLFAKNPEIAAALINALASVSAATYIILDVPDHNGQALKLATSFGLSPSFETARMYKGAPPAQQQGWIFGETTLELG